MILIFTTKVIKHALNVNIFCPLLCFLIVVVFELENVFSNSKLLLGLTLHIGGIFTCVLVKICFIIDATLSSSSHCYVIHI